MRSDFSLNRGCVMYSLRVCISHYVLKNCCCFIGCQDKTFSWRLKGFPHGIVVIVTLDQPYNLFVCFLLINVLHLMKITEDRLL